MKPITFALSSILLFVLVMSCGKDSTDNEVEPTIEEPSSSWEVIQTLIFDTKCVSCHTAGTSFATQSNLVLTADVAYNNLIDQVPHNAAAANDGLKLLETNGLESLYSSFLWEKINAPDQEHFYEDHPEYGEIMPLSAPALTNGALEYIRQWIIAGAPDTGVVAAAALLDDTSIFQPTEEEFEALPLPASGIQLHTGTFEVAPNFERELYLYQNLENTEDIYVNNIEIAMRPGTHHMILYDFYSNATLPEAGIIRDIRDENNNDIFSTYQSIQDQVFVFGTQFRHTDYHYPEGVALKIPAEKGLDINVHYTNYGEEPITGEVYANLHTISASEVQHEAKNLFLSKQNFNLPPNQESSVYAEYIFGDTRSVFMLTAHAHKHMKEFRIFINGGPRDGELVYFTNDWEHPQIQTYDPPLILTPGEGLRGEALYNNDTNNTLGFGLLSTDEMMIIFGAYYTD